MQFAFSFSNLYSLHTHEQNRHLSLVFSLPIFLPHCRLDLSVAIACHAHVEHSISLLWLLLLLLLLMLQLLLRVLLCKHGRAPASGSCAKAKRRGCLRHCCASKASTTSSWRASKDKRCRLLLSSWLAKSERLLLLLWLLLCGLTEGWSVAPGWRRGSKSCLGVKGILRGGWGAKDRGSAGA